MSAVSASPIPGVEELDAVRTMQRALYRAAKADPGRRFHALYDKVYRRDVLQRAWLSMPAEEGLRADRQSGPGWARQGSALGSEQEAGLPARAADLAFENPELVTESQHLSPEPVSAWGRVSRASSRKRTRKYEGRRT